MTSQVRTMTMPAATAPAKMVFETLRPIKGVNIAGTAMLTGHTAIKVSNAIFHCGGSGWVGLRNQASSP